MVWIFSVTLASMCPLFFSFWWFISFNYVTYLLVFPCGYVTGHVKTQIWDMVVSSQWFSPPSGVFLQFLRTTQVAVSVATSDMWLTYVASFGLGIASLTIGWHNNEWRSEHIAYLKYLWVNYWTYHNLQKGIPVISTRYKRALFIKAVPHMLTYATRFHLGGNILPPPLYPVATMNLSIFGSIYPCISTQMLMSQAQQLQTKLHTDR